MRTEVMRPLSWCVVGSFASWVAVRGAVDVLYRYFPNEPLTLTFGLALTVISLIGIVRSARRGPWWCLIPTTVVAIAATIGIVTDSTLLLLGLTISGFY
ncbi:hypothetical protein [Levilactobacillus fujinensis]|uniref:Integral membrane protein n=1 Tax=Levilactobacillus fujinensis TaxID=2486024 RepID=A0ABW1TJP0_9LACO|nr:hypothetical protein [Levilactobacillus fujinensis]